MGEKDDAADAAAAGLGTNGNAGDGEEPIEIEDEGEEDPLTGASPYGGTGLGAIAAANRGV